LDKSSSKLRGTAFDLLPTRLAVDCCGDIFFEVVKCDQQPEHMQDTYYTNIVLPVYIQYTNINIETPVLNLCSFLKVQLFKYCNDILYNLGSSDLQQISQNQVASCGGKLK
jgi:hypothetical protein